MPITYIALGEKYINKVANDALAEAFAARIKTKQCSQAMKERLRRTKITVMCEIGYPPHGEFEQQKKGGPRPKFRAYHKTAPRITYNAVQEQTIKELLPDWKVLLRDRGIGKHVYGWRREGSGVDGGNRGRRGSRDAA